MQRLILLAVLAGGVAVGQLTSTAAEGKKKKLPTKDQLPWAFKTPARPAVPTSLDPQATIRNPIDAFIVAGLARAKLRQAPAAERATLLRRVTFDLTGLPPTLAEMDAFLGDSSSDAYEKVVDRLLASPRYGERWAMYWLDLVRYAESDGFRADDARPLAWRYRDYVIKAFNDDKPYDRFLQEQLAGDELYPDDAQALIATGFNRHFPDEHNARNLTLRRQEILNDMTDTVGLVFMGLTVGCARCHDHRYDPILQEDYYRLQAFFAAYATRDNVVLGEPAQLRQWRERQQAWEAQTAELRTQMRKLAEPVERKLGQSNKSKFAPELQQAFDMPAEQRTPFQQQIAYMVGKQVKVDQGSMVKAMAPPVREQWQGIEKELKAFEHLKPPALPVAMALTDIGPLAPPTHLLERGNYLHPGAAVQPGFLRVLDDGKPAPLPPPAADARTTGRRSVLAKWLTSPAQPLTARVMVNRLWQHHFGRGLVGTPSDFGAQGDVVTHPELLDWLATEFMARGWSLKAMHRLLVTSATYRQTSRASEASVQADPTNKLLTHMNRRRLEGETLRDTMLQVSGQLNLKMGGPSIYPELPTELGAPRGWPTSKEASERNRRSIYVFAKRNARYPLFSTFDAPDGNEPCARRHLTTSAPQALLLLNSQLTLELAKQFAAAVLQQSGQDGSELIRLSYRLALGRGPDAAELTLAHAFLKEQTALIAAQLAAKQAVALPAGMSTAHAGAVVEFCHVLLNLNELAYID